MASIVFFADHNEEALRASFELAKQLKRERNSVFYAGVSDSGRCAAESGLDFVPIYESAHTTCLDRDIENHVRISERRTALLSLFFSSSNELDVLVQHVNLKFVFLPPYLALEGLLLTRKYPLLVGFLNHVPREESRHTSVRKECNEVLENSIFGAATTKYLSTLASGALNIESLVEDVCQIPEYVISLSASQEEVCGHDENVYPLDCTANVTSILLGRTDSHFESVLTSDI